jgi:hypothetical protein
VLGKNGNSGHYEGSQKYGISSTVCAVFNNNDFFYHQSQNICTVSNIPNNRTVNSPNALSNHISEFLDL